MNIMIFRKTVTFLYKLVRGVSPKSYGIHVAHMAGIPIEIIENAANYSSDYSHSGSLAKNNQRYIHCVYMYCLIF